MMQKSGEKAFYVVGLGRSGAATYTFLQDRGYKVLAWDDAMAEKNPSNIPLTPPKEIDWGQIGEIVLSPGIPLTHPEPHPIVKSAKSHNIPIISDFDIFFRHAKEGIFIGITGTNGKSTTAALTHHLLTSSGMAAYLGGNIGIPICALPLPQEETDIFILEVSSYQLDLIQENMFDIAVLTNITPDHLSRHGSLEGYVESKEKIFRHMKGDSLPMVGLDSALSNKVYNSLKDRGLSPITIGSASKKCDYSFAAQNIYKKAAPKFDPDLNFLYADAEKRAHILTPALRGAHNEENVCFAVAIFDALLKKLDRTVSKEDLSKTLNTFKGLSHRQEIVTTAPFIVVNDSKATNLISAAMAIKSFSHIHWLMGGKFKEGADDIGEMLPLLGNIDVIYTFGETASLYEKLFAPHIKTYTHESIEGALEKALENAKKELSLGISPTILLSPACPSFDQFKDFEERGDYFKKIVREKIRSDF